jgi:bifunctional DNA-binding transcriptional regulator/antitoxin component of YhaV-PrlF toxin-antitoxin module
MRITAKGQVTIPIEIRERYGLLPDTEVRFVVDRRGVRIVKVEEQEQGRGKLLVAHLRRVGGETRTTGMTTDQILELTRGG